MNIIIAFINSRCSKFYYCTGAADFMPYEASINGHRPSDKEMLDIVQSLYRDRINAGGVFLPEDVSVAVVHDNTLSRGDVQLYKTSDLVRKLPKIAFIDKALLMQAYYIRKHQIDAQKVSHAVYLSGDGEDLYASLYSIHDMEYVATKVIKGEARDPRLEQAVDYVWNKAYDQCDCSRQEEEPYIRKAVSEFLKSESNVKEHWQLSKFEVTAHLSKDQLSANINAHRSTFSDVLLSFVKSKDVSLNECTVVLEQEIATSDYFRSGVTGLIHPLYEEETQIEYAMSLVKESFEQGKAIKDLVEHTAVAPEPPVTGGGSGTGTGSDPCLEEINPEPKIVPSDIIQFSIQHRVKVTKSGFLGLKKSYSLHLEIEILDGKALPCTSMLIVTNQRQIRYNEDNENTFEEDCNRGLTGTLEFDVDLDTLPLDKTKEIKVYLWPVKAEFTSKYKNNSISFKI